MLALILSIFLFVFIFGVCIGSFLNVVILRALSGESIVFPASKCPKCQNALKWYHNIPILSYLFLRGKCAYCKDRISLQYPIVEFVTGLAFVATFLKFGLGFKVFFVWAICSMFIVLAMTDIKEKVIFVRHAYILLGLACLMSLLNLNPLYKGVTEVLGFEIYTSVVQSFLGIILGIVIMEILARVGYLFAGTRAFGEGDTYIAACMGALFGWRGFVYAIILSVIIQLFFTVPLFIKKLLNRKDYITLATIFVFVGAIILNRMAWVPFALSVILLFASAGYLCYRLLKDMRGEGDLMYLPFGPAMLLASFILLML